MLLLIDHYDSFVHNLARYFERLGQFVRVVRSDATDVAGVRAMRPKAVVLSPGPCTPREAGMSLEIVRYLASEIPLLGVCLGHQIIAEAMGARVVRAPLPVHGQASQIEHEGTGLFAGLPSPFTAGRYHSLVVQPQSLPSALRPTAWTRDNILMAFEHEHLPVFGVQFHPESILTEGGYLLLANFLRLVGLHVTLEPGELARTEKMCQPPHRRPLPLGPVPF